MLSREATLRRANSFFYEITMRLHFIIQGQEKGTKQTTLCPTFIQISKKDIIIARPDQPRTGMTQNSLGHVANNNTSDYGREMVLGNFQFQGVLLILIVQGHDAPAVDASEGAWISSLAVFFLRLSTD